ncbi:MAG: COX15/CtaA family protein [Terrimicrobiaceae bacterium]|nr:COX15/CtaA family protein [Terrimicrobiaceae bacterium]
MHDLPLNRRLLHILAACTAVYTFFVLASGGLVTSKNAGMSVPDWPTTFGYNMFLFPVSRWVGPIFYEHSHRLLASSVGLLLIALAAGLALAEPRRWVKMLGYCALGSVCLQGVLGGLRVVLNEDQIGILHGVLAQLLFVLLGVIAAATSPGFVAGGWAPARRVASLRWLALALAVIVFAQLGIAATMRHAHAGLSIHDFPAAYGRVLPDTSPAALAAINAARQAAGEAPTTAGLIWLQMAHRAVAGAIFLLALALAWRARDAIVGVRRTAWLLVAMLVVQIALGICTIWYDKPADVATAHMALGALTLFVSARLAFRLFVMQVGLREETLEFPAGGGYSRLSA